MSRFPSTQNLFGGNKNKAEALQFAQITGVRRIKSQDTKVVDPITNQPLDPIATIATLAVDIITFTGQQVYKNVNLLSPLSCIAGSGMYVSPQVGDQCVVGFARKGQPIILGFFIPPDKNGTSFGELPIALNSGELAILCPDTSGIVSGIFWRQGGVVRMQAGSNALWEVNPAGDIITGLARNFIFFSSSGAYEIRERNTEERETFRRERIARIATTVDKDAAFIEKQSGDITADELLAELRNVMPGVPIVQENVNNKTFKGEDDKGSQALRGTDSEAVLDQSFSGKLKFNLGFGDGQIIIAVDSDSKEASITINGTTIAVKDNEVSIETTNEVKINANQINLGGGAEGVALGETLTQFLTQINLFLSTHTHTGNLGVPTSPATTPAPALPVIASIKVKVT